MKWLPFFIFLIGSQHISAQSGLKKIKDIKTKSASHLMVDRLGNFFVVQKNSDVKKFDPNGNMLAKLKSKRSGITLLEPWYHPSIFVYNRQLQAIITYDRNFENQKSKTIEPSLAVEPHLVCPRSDNRWLLLDAGDNSVKVVNPLTNTVQSEFLLEANIGSDQPKFTYLREYQNMIFLLEPTNGIFIFSNIGKLINKIEVSGLRNFNFFGEEIYYLHGNQLIFLDLYTEEKRTIDLPEKYLFALATDERLIFISEKGTLSLFELPVSLLEK